MIIDFEYERDRRWADKFENKLKKSLVVQCLKLEPITKMCIKVSI
jgi:hypothetical protein